MHKLEFSHGIYQLVSNRLLFPSCILCASLSFFACDDSDKGSGNNLVAGNEIGAGESEGAMMVGSSGGESMGGNGIASCMNDNDCPAGTLCDADAQACRSACNLDQDCGPSEACVSNFCTALTMCEGFIGANGTSS